MNTCFITGLITSNKWKGKYIHPEFLNYAKKLREVNGGSLATNIRIMQRDLKKKSKHAEIGSSEKYVEFLNKYLGGGL